MANDDTKTITNTKITPEELESIKKLNERVKKEVSNISFSDRLAREIESNEKNKQLVKESGIPERPRWLEDQQAEELRQQRESARLKSRYPEYKSPSELPKPTIVSEFATPEVSKEIDLDKYRQAVNAENAEMRRQAQIRALEKLKSYGAGAAKYALPVMGAADVARDIYNGNPMGALTGLAAIAPQVPVRALPFFELLNPESTVSEKDEMAELKKYREMLQNKP
jgi:hypothetical protein